MIYVAQMTRIALVNYSYDIYSYGYGYDSYGYDGYDSYGYGYDSYGYGYDGYSYDRYSYSYGYDRYGYGYDSYGYGYLINFFLQILDYLFLPNKLFFYGIQLKIHLYLFELNLDHPNHNHQKSLFLQFLIF